MLFWVLYHFLHPWEYRGPVYQAWTILAQIQTLHHPGDGCSCNSTAISDDHVWGLAMYRASESGQDANLPPLYISYSPTIVQHSTIDWHNHKRTSAIRSSPLGTNSLNHVTFLAMSWIASWLSVKQVLHSKFCEAINLKQRRDTNYNLPFHSDTYTHILFF